jgi:hypothetical protein
MSAPQPTCPSCGQATPASSEIESEETTPGAPDPMEMVGAASALIAAHRRLSQLVADAEWLAAPFRIEGGDEYTDMREHLDSAGHEARAAARVIYLIGQSAMRAQAPPSEPQ